MNALLSRVIARLVRVGRLRVEFFNGEVREFGDGTGPVVGVRLTDRSVLWDIVTDPELKFGEAYMDGRIVITEGELYDLIAVGSANLWKSNGLAWIKVMEQWRARLRTATHSARTRSRRNGASHYDLDPRLYDLSLDADRQYS